MRRSFIIAWALLLAGLCCVQQSSAFWQSRDSNYNKAIATSGGGYVGPGDVAPNAAFWGSCARAYTAAYAASHGNMCLLYGVTTTATCQLVANSLGFADVTSTYCVGSTVSVTTFCTVTNASCTIETLDDQTGNLASPPTQTNTTKRPTLDLGVNGLNGLPVMDSTASGSIILSSGSTLTTSAPTSMNGVYIRTTETTNIIIGSGAGNLILETGTSANTAHLSCGTAQNPAANDNVWTSLSMECGASGTGAYNINGTDTSASINLGSNVFSAANVNVDAGVPGKVAEVGIWYTPNDLSTSTSRNTLFNNQNSANGYGGLL